MQATDTPGHLRGLVQGHASAREHARRELSLSVIHQGTHWEGSPEATQCLVELVLESRVSDRPALLALLSYLATTYEDRKWRRSVLELPRRAEVPLWRASWEAIAARGPELVPLLEDEDATVRAQAAVLLAFLPSIAAEATPRLARLLEGEDELAAGSAALALAAFTLQGVAAAAGLLRRGLATAEDARADACAIGLAWLGDRDEQTIARLAVVIARPPPSQPKLPWHDDLALLALEPLEPLDARTPGSIIGAVYRSLESVQDADHFTVMDRVEPLLEVVLPRQPSAEPLLFNELTPRQLQLLRVLATAPNLAGGNVSNALRDRRVPCGGEQRRMFLGLGACDRGHESRTFQLPDGETRYWPLWRFVIALARNAAWVAPGAEELARHFSTRELLSGWGELDAAIRLAWGGGEGWGYFERAIASRLGREPELPVIPLVSAFERTPREVREALWDVWATLQEGGRVADVVLVAALDHAPPRLPWVEALVAARPPLEREALVLAALRRAPAGDLRALGSEVGHPEPVRGPWRYLELALTEAVACAVFDVLERVHAWDVPLAEVLRFLARLPEATLDRLERPGVAVMLRRARWVRDGGQRTSDELARDLQAWFREGVTLESGESPGSPAPTCASCAAVFRHLGLDAEGLGAGAVGGVRSGSDDWPRTRGFVQGHWQTGGLVEVATGEGPHHPTVEAAILAATTGGNAVDRGCVELAALSAIAARLEQWYRELHQHLQTG